MVEKCKNCGAKIVKFPLRDNNGKFIWQNLFKMSMDSVILLLVITAMLVAYKLDTETCMQIVEDPLGYCDKSNACKVLEEQRIIESNKIITPADIGYYP